MKPVENSAVSPYAFPQRALRRWARENLTFGTGSDGAVHATFRLEGSTCGNITFFLLYHVALAPESADRRIVALRCEPAPQEENHKRMCCWQANATTAAAAMHHEIPLLGQPLESVLTWRPRRSPDGCLCVEPSRHYKWQAVLETLHFALGL
ncbi:MAG: hypothetical protein Q8J74_00835, partial [Candidatus Didemnitutus sp.]|nr:hypothetical protein [Candidatus Didemnitutus sp.]